MYWMDDRLRMALLKENAAYRKFWKRYDCKAILDADIEKREYYLKHPGGYIGRDPNCPAAAKMLYDFFGDLNNFNIAFQNGELPHGEELKLALGVLDPFHEDLPDDLPFYFHKYPPMAQLVESTGDPYDAMKGKVTPEHHYIVPTALAISNLQPWERLLRIDLRRSKKDIIEDMRFFIDQVDELRNKPVGWSSNYHEWQPDVSREQKNAWRDLKIWQMRRGANRKTFLQISRELKIKVDAAKKAFAHAYFLIEGRRYDGDKKRLKKVDKKELKRTCATCPEKPSCKDPCPDVLAFIDQDCGCLFGRLTSPGVVESDIPRRRNKAKLADD